MEIIQNENKTITLIPSDFEIEVIDWMIVNNRMDDFSLVINKFLGQRYHQIKFEETKKLYSSLSSEKREKIMKIVDGKEE